MSAAAHAAKTKPFFQKFYSMKGDVLTSALADQFWAAFQTIKPLPKVRALGPTPVEADLQRR
jgi:hypothetical protein